MSLTSFLKIPQIKDGFKNEFPWDTISTKDEMRAEPVTKNYSGVGTAFDYLLRFFLEYTNPNCISRTWVAKDALDRVSGHTRDAGMKATQKARSLFEDVQQVHQKYMETGEINDELIRGCIVFSQLDAIYRTGVTHPNLGSVNDGDVEDLRNLISLVKPDTFKIKNKCYLNPTFGHGSEMVGGADADLIVDGMLIDIKTTKKRSFTRNHYHQLVGYYILSKLGKINGTEDVEITDIGIYFSRHSILSPVSVEHIEQNPGFPKFVKWFEENAKKAY